MLFVDPQEALNQEVLAALANQGFRRSGELIYRPHCQGCRACIPLRVPVSQFTPRRGQRRTWRKNQDLMVRRCEAACTDEHFALYRRYQAHRHPQSRMDDPDPRKYAEFLISRNAETRFIEFRLPSNAATGAAEDGAASAGKLVCVAVVDVMPDSLSAVYTFYDPHAASRGLGCFAVLWEIEEAKRLGLPWLYLGYWIENHDKMAYKANFRPVEAFQNDQWQLLRA